MRFRFQGDKISRLIFEAGVGIKIDPENIQVISAGVPQRDVKRLRKFMGFANFYRDFVHKFTDPMFLLQLLVNKNIPFSRRRINKLP